MKTRIITELFKTAEHPVALVRDDTAEWHNRSFASLSDDNRQRLIDHAIAGEPGPMLLDGYLFELLHAKHQRLLIGTSCIRDDSEKRLIRSLLPALAEGGDPWLTTASILGPALNWSHCAAIKHKSASTDELLGHWHAGKLNSPEQLSLTDSAAAELYGGGNEQLILFNPAELYPQDRLFRNDPPAVTLMQRVELTGGQAVGILCAWGKPDTASLALSARLLAISADLLACHLAMNGREPGKELPTPLDHPLDELTGLSGRAAFDATLEAFEEHYQQYGQNCEMAMLDINGLSSINQLKGTTFGDDVLRTFAQKLSQICRPEDRVFRFGGDEFVVLMPYRQDPPPLQKRLIEIEQEMRKLPGLDKFSASAGIANLLETSGSSDDLMLLSDRRLRQAKTVRNETQGTDNAQ
ncbi:GGDEF domain-containing protein [Marinobacterium zhoushanense]|uniref:GGDEF domain-containing protein n=1 Tax=Marinobacterium zhoushanense TaxID=1679163 RepID=UPI00166530DE|nr:GGDEF domain-containing protein [Marinobacterium zhoushanense]